MEHQTVINPALHAPAPTVINRALLVRPDTAEQPFEIVEGTVICGRYSVVRKLDVHSGEGELYLCRRDETDYVAKVYNRAVAIKQEVIDALRQIDSPHVAKLYETGEYHGYPVEILPYYKNGSLQGRQFSAEELKDGVIPDVNEGLNVLHRAGIIHKDLKPSNIMICDDGTTYAIIDFGISSAVDEGSTILVTKTGMTPEYSAPETFKNIFYEGSDYYSLGITLYELFCGSTPYTAMQPDEIEQYISIQRIPFPEEMPAELQDLIGALTYYDISYRNNKANPNRRWTYEEVRRWLNGETQVIPGEGIGNAGMGSMPPYKFLGKEYTELSTLVCALAANWEQGKKQLFRGYLAAHFRLVNPELARLCLMAEEQAGRENGKDDIIFWQLLHRLCPQMKAFVWNGKSYESLSAFGRDVLERLWVQDHSQFPFYNSLLSEQLLSAHVKATAPKNEALLAAATALEDSFWLDKANGSDIRRTYYLMAYTLSGQKQFVLDGEQYRTVGELVSYMKEILTVSVQRFKALCHRLVDYDGQLDYQLEAWLIAIGKQSEIEQWRTAMRE